MSRGTANSRTSSATRAKTTDQPTTSSDSSAESAGLVEAKVRADVAALVSTHPMGEALAEMAFSLARTLDQGAGMAVAAVARELRAILVELAETVVDDDDDFDALMSSPVRDDADAGEADPGPGDGRGGSPSR